MKDRERSARDALNSAALAMQLVGASMQQFAHGRMSRDMLREQAIAGAALLDATIQLVTPTQEEENNNAELQ